MPPKRAVQQRRLRGNYSDEEKTGAPEWIQQLMRLADVNSNKKGGGGTQDFRSLQERVVDMAPEHWKEHIKNVPFVPKTKGIHGHALDQIIQQVLPEAQPIDEEAQPIQDGEAPKAEVQIGGHEPAIGGMPVPPVEAALAEVPEEPPLKRQKEVHEDALALRPASPSREDSMAEFDLLLKTLSTKEKELAKYQLYVENLEAKNSRLEREKADLQERLAKKEDDLSEMTKAYQAEVKFRRKENIENEILRTKNKEKEKRQKDEEAKRQILQERHQRQMTASLGAMR